MRRIILLVGKGLIAFSLLWPVPFGFIMYPLFGYKINMPMWGIEKGYWWPLLGVIALGFLLCWISRYTPASPPSKKNIPMGFTHSPFYILLRLTFYGLCVFAGILVVAAVVIGLYYALCTEYIKIVFPVGAAATIFGFTCFFGYVLYRNNGDNGDDNDKRRRD